MYLSLSLSLSPYIYIYIYIYTERERDIKQENGCMLRYGSFLLHQVTPQVFAPQGKSAHDSAYFTAASLKPSDLSARL